MFPIFFDPLYMIVALAGIVISLAASALVKGAYAKYSRIPTSLGYTGAEAARAILANNSIYDVTIEPVQGFLSDHYDPTKKVLRLSPDNYYGQSIAAVGIAAHEAGHAVQHARSYGPMALRHMLVPVANIGSNIGIYIAMAGIFMDLLGLAQVGILLFGGFLLFQVVTLPVEFDASSRAKKALAQTGIIADSREMAGVSRVLTAAGLTYVAAVVSTLLTLLYLMMRAGLLGGSRRD